VDSKKWAVDSGHETVDSGHETVDSGNRQWGEKAVAGTVQRAVGKNIGQRAVDS
jgi:hypothetical protein